MADFDCPSCDGDAERDGQVPEGAMRLRDRLLATDGFLLVSPEYNASMPGILKNVIDWTSRLRSVEAARHYPTIKTKWIEFLGEHPDEATDRVEETDVRAA